MHYFASTIPIMRDTSVLRRNPNSNKDPKTMKLDGAFALISYLEPKDHLWLMMGSTNAAVAVGAFRRGVTVHQLSHSRAMPLVKASRNGNSPDETQNGAKIKISAADVLSVASKNPDLFYPIHTKQAEVLEIIAAWNQVTDAMKTRQASANLVRSRLQHQAVTTGFVRGQQVDDKKQLAALIDVQVGKDPADQGMQILFDKEKEAVSHLNKVAKGSDLYQQVFEPINGMGPKIAARFISAIERIERFAKAKDLSNYAGMLPRGPEGKLPSRKRSKSSGEPLSRKAQLNNACYMFQDQIFGYGANSELGQMLHGQIQKTCPCDADMRKADAKLRSKHSEAARMARIAITRHLLEKIIWPRWQAYMRSSTS